MAHSGVRREGLRWPPAGFRREPVAFFHRRLPAQILLYESRAEMNVHLDERAIPDGFEAVNLARFDNENVSSATFKRLSVHGPYPAAFPDKLDLIVGMPMRPGPLARRPVEQKHADAHVS